MGSEFQAPQNRESRGIDGHDSSIAGKTVLKPLDQAIVTALTLIVCALLSWIAYTSYQNSVAIAQLNSQFESVKQDRDLSLIYIERRLGALEDGVANLNKRIDGHDGRN